MAQSLLSNYDIFQSKILRKEDELFRKSYLYGKSIEGVNAYKYISNLFDHSLTNINKAYTRPVKLYNNHPINAEELKKFEEDLKYDLEVLYSLVNKHTNMYNMVIQDTDEKYKYRGTKLLNQLFQLEFLRARYAQKVLVFEDFQNNTKNAFDGKFFVDRALGFVAKSVVAMNYFDPNVRSLTTPSRTLTNGQGYYPSSIENSVEVMLDLTSTQIINFLYWDVEFSGDQYFDNIDYILFSVDGVNYTQMNPYLLYFINAGFKNIYDQNFFTGFIPIHPVAAKYIKFGVRLKNPTDPAVFKDIKVVRAEFNTDFEDVKVTVMKELPYVASANVDQMVYFPWTFNHVKGQLIFEPNFDLSYSLEMSVDQSILTRYINDNTNRDGEFARNNYKYSSPILFNYSIMVGF